MADLKGGTTIAGYEALHEGNLLDILQYLNSQGLAINADLIIDGLTNKKVTQSEKNLWNEKIRIIPNRNQPAIIKGDIWFKIL